MARRIRAGGWANICARCLPAASPRISRFCRSACLAPCPWWPAPQQRPAMKDLTQGPIARHIFEMAAPMAIGMLIQTLYYLVDLYFVAKIGDAAIAGVASAGNVMFIVLGLTQMLGVGTVAL